MNFLLHQGLDLLLHLDQHLFHLVQKVGAWSYLLLGAIIFCETGLVITPILPGDSLLFAAGALAAQGLLDPLWLLALLSLAAVLGDTANYALGAWAGTRFLNRFMKKKYLDRTHQFYEKYGNKTIVLARFVPVVRTFAPFVAGLGRMRYARFFLYNVMGGTAWVLLLILAGYFFGRVPLVQRNFSTAILIIIFISILPAIFEYVRVRRTAATPNDPPAVPTNPKRE